MTLKEVEKYSQDHLHGQQVVWKLHLEEFGSSAKHLSCPIETRESLYMYMVTRSGILGTSSRNEYNNALVVNTSQCGSTSLEEQMATKEVSS